MYLYVAETKKDNDNHLTAEIIEEITQEELDKQIDNRYRKYLNNDVQKSYL